MCGSSLLARHSLRITPTQGSRNFRSGPQSCRLLARLAVRCSVALALALALRRARVRARPLMLARLLLLLVLQLLRLARVLVRRLAAWVHLVARLSVAPLVALREAPLIIQDRLACSLEPLAVAWVAILAWAAPWMACLVVLAPPLLQGQLLTPFPAERL